MFRGRLGSLAIAAMLAPHTAAGGEGGGGGGAGNAGSDGKPAGDPKPPTQDPPKWDAEKIKALEDKAAKSESFEQALSKEQKARKELEARIKTPEFAMEMVQGALGMKKDADPRKELEQLNTQKARAELYGAKSTVRAWALEKLLSTDVKPERAKIAVNNMNLAGVKFDLETGEVDGDEVFATALAALRTELPEVFKVAAGEKEPASPAPGSPKPPVVGQPQHKAPGAGPKTLTWPEFYALPVKEQKAYREAMAAARAGS